MIILGSTINDIFILIF